MFSSRSTILLAAASAAIVGIGMAAGPALATPTTGWLQTAAGTYDYNTPANWVGGTINGDWDSTLGMAGAQTVTMASTPLTSTGLSFAYTGGYNLTIEATTNPVTFYLAPGAGITDNVASSKVVTLGGGSKTLTIDLGGGTQTFTSTITSSNLQIGAVIANGAVTIGGTANVGFSADNTYAGMTTIDSGTYLGVNSLADGGVASTLGESSNAASNLMIAGSLNIFNSGSTDRLFTLAGNSNIIEKTTSASVTFSNSGTLAFSAANTAHTLTLEAIGTGATLVFDPLISNDGTGTTSVILQDNAAPTITLGNANNSYTGATKIQYGYGATLVVSSLADGGVASSIGESTNVAANLVFDNANTLEYVGTGSSTNRNFTVGYNTAKPGGGTFTVNSSGTGALVMSGTQTYSITASTDTLGLALDGTSATSLVNEYNGAIVNPTGTPTNNSTYHYSVTKSDANTWALGGANTYTGTTTVNGGALLITGSLASGSAVTVNSTGTLGGGGTIGGGVTLASGSTLAPSFDAATPTMLTVGSLSAGSGSTIDLNISGAANDSVKVTTSGGLTYAGTLAITDAVPQFGTYQLFSFTGSASGDFGAVNVGGNAMTDSGGTWTLSNGGFNYTFTDSTGVLAVTGSAIPEPATLGLMAVAGAGILLVGRKRKVA